MTRQVDCDNNCEMCLTVNRGGIMPCEGEDNRVTLTVHYQEVGGLVLQDYGILNMDEATIIYDELKGDIYNGKSMQITIEPVQRRRFNVR